MKFSEMGSTHVNNQDYAFKIRGVKGILDGCSKTSNEESLSEVGSRLFGQVLSNTFSTLMESKPLESILLNFDNIVDEIMNKFVKSFSDLGLTLGWSEEKICKLIDSNFCFTTLLCFELPDRYVVKAFGDGYIITVNMEDKVSYIKLYYGEYPPYIIYNYNGVYKLKKKFKTFEFSKTDFLRVGVSSDGIEPIVKTGKKMDLEKQKEFDKYIINSNKEEILYFIEANHLFFYDDTTACI